MPDDYTFGSAKFKPGDLYQVGEYDHEWVLITKVEQDSYFELSLDTFERREVWHMRYKWIEVYRDGEVIYSPFMTRIWEWNAQEQL